MYHDGWDFDPYGGKKFDNTFMRWFLIIANLLCCVLCPKYMAFNLLCAFIVYRGIK